MVAWFDWTCWLGEGSLIVVKGKKSTVVAHGVEKIYEVEVLDYDH